MKDTLAACGGAHAEAASAQESIYLSRYVAIRRSGWFGLANLYLGRSRSP